MTDNYGQHMRSRRRILGISQRALAERSGVKQPLIAAIESGRRAPSEAARAALDQELAVRPSQALSAQRREVLALVERAGLGTPRVFGSVARGEDDESSDLDLVVEFTDDHDIVDLLALEHALSELLTVPVDVVDARAAGRVMKHGDAEAVPL